MGISHSASLTCRSNSSMAPTVFLARSDDLGNNIEHIYVPGGLAVGQPYTIAVKAKTTASPIRYGLAWQARRSALQHEVWRE